MIPDKIELTFLNEYENLELALLDLGFLSKSVIRKWILKKALKQKVFAKKQFSLPINLINHGRIYPKFNGEKKPMLIADEPNYRAFHKPAGVHTVALNYNETDNLCAWIREQNFETSEKLNFSTMNRLDLETSGVVIQKLCDELKMVKKIYIALVEKGKGIEESMSDSLMTWSQNASLVKVRDERDEGDEGKISHARAFKLFSDEKYDVMAIDLETGFKHQIRVQLASRGCPIIGDLKYGGQKANRLMLHAFAYQIEWQHQDQKEYKWLIDNQIGLMSSLFDFDRAFKMISDKVGISN